MRRVSKRVNKSRRRVSKRMKKSRRISRRKSRQERQDKNRKTRKQMKRSKRKRTRRVSKRKIRSKSKSKYIEGGGGGSSKASRAAIYLGSTDENRDKEVDNLIKNLLSFGVEDVDLQGDGVDISDYFDEIEHSIYKTRALCERRVIRSGETQAILREYVGFGGYFNQRGECEDPVAIYRDLDKLLSDMTNKTITSDMFCVNAMSKNPQRMGGAIAWIEAYEKYGVISEKIDTYAAVLEKAYTTPEGAISLGNRLGRGRGCGRQALIPQDEWSDLLMKHSLLHKRKEEVAVSLAKSFIELQLRVGAVTKEQFIEEKCGRNKTDREAAATEYARLNAFIDETIYKEFTDTHFKPGGPDISESVFRNLRVKYPHLAAAEGEQEAFLDEQRRLFKTEQKRAEAEELKKQKINHSWIGYRRAARGRWYYTNLMYENSPMGKIYHDPTIYVDSPSRTSQDSKNIIYVDSPVGDDGLHCAENRYEQLREQFPDTWWTLDAKVFGTNMGILTKTPEIYGTHPRR